MDARPDLALMGVADLGITDPDLALAATAPAGAALAAAHLPVGGWPRPAPSHPAGSSTGWVTRCWPVPSVTTRVSTATNAVNRHSTP
jgi:hypothetical protein